MRLVAPCKGCEQREVGCHVWCEKYIEFRRLKDEQNEEIKRANEVNQALNDIERKRRISLATGRMRKRRNK